MTSVVIAQQVNVSKFDRICDLLKIILTSTDEKVGVILITVGLSMTETAQSLWWMIFDKVLGPIRRPEVVVAGTDLFQRLQEVVQFLGYGMVFLGVIVLLFGFLLPVLEPFKRIILHYSYEPIEPGAVKKMVTGKTFFKSIFYVDARDAVKSPCGIEREIEKIKNFQERLFKGRELYYCGISHLPFVGLAGFNLRNAYVKFIEIDHLNRAPCPIASDPSSTIPLQITSAANIQSEVVLSMSISRTIQKSAIQAKFPGIPEYSLDAVTPGLFNVKSKEQMEQVVSEFRNVLDEFLADSKLKTIHLLYAGQTSLLFRMCQVINVNTDKEIIVYHYDGTEGYSWGISLNRGGRYVQLP